MKRRDNEAIRAEVERNAKLYSAMRRSDIALQFRQFMISKRIKNIDLASRIGVSEANVSRWLKGNQNLSLDTLYLLADALEEHLVLHVGEAAPASILNEEGCKDTDHWSTWEEHPPTNVILMGQYREEWANRSKNENYSPARSQLIGDSYDCPEAAA